MSFIDISSSDSKSEIFKRLESKLQSMGFTITQIDDQRPWGGFLRIADLDAPNFHAQFFKQAEFIQDVIQTPKILVVAPEQRLSWQYHYRRQEIWQVLQGPIKVARSLTDADPQERMYQEGDTVQLDLKERHRLIGTTEWGIVAEIWFHTDPDNPSDEQDIVRVLDDYGRQSQR